MTKLIPRLLLALTILALSLLIHLPFARADGRTVREFTFVDFDAALPLISPSNEYGGKIADGMRNYKDDVNRVFVEAVSPPPDGPRTVTVLRIDNPGVSQPRYSLRGEIKYDKVDGDAYLEMWSDFADGGHYFSRTLGDSGPMMKVTGTSAKRQFMLPFYNQRGEVPNRLTLNVVLPGRGKITLGRMRLVEDGPPATAPTLEERMRQRRERARSQGDTATSAPATLKNRLNTLDGDVLALEDPLYVPDRAVEVLKRTPPLAAAVAAAMTPSDVTYADDGVSGFAFTADDPTGTRQMVIREYAAGSIPAKLTGHVTWRGQTNGTAKIGYWLEDTDGKRTPSPAGFKLVGEQGSVDFMLPVSDRSARRLTVAVLCPGPVRVDIALNGSGLAAFAPVAWLGRHSTYVFAGLVALALLAVIPLRRLMKSGRGRTIVLGFFGLMFAGGVAQLFAAGVALGMGRPADAWVTLLGGAAILLVCGGLMLQQARAHYAGFELRKLRAMDVG